MTDQRTLKRIINEQHAEIQQLKQIMSILQKNCEGTNKLYAEKYEQVEAANQKEESMEQKIYLLLPECKAFTKGCLGSADCGHLWKGKCCAYPEVKCKSQKVESAQNSGETTK